MRYVRCVIEGDAGHEAQGSGKNGKLLSVVRRPS